MSAANIQEAVTGTLVNFQVGQNLTPFPVLDKRSIRIINKALWVITGRKSNYPIIRE